MFCLMDVSGSMTEHMKDLAKRFYIAAVHLFLEALLQAMSKSSSSGIPTRPSEVDEETFFYSP